MKTYITLWFNSEGIPPSQVIKKLEDIGFRPVKGNYDMEYDWGRPVTVEEVLDLGDRVQALLKDAAVLFKLETV